MSHANARALLLAARLHRGERARFALSLALACGASLAAVALLTTSGYLISRAAQRPPILLLMVAIVAVRAFGIARASMRYGERLSAHDLALRRLARLRARFYARLEPRVPGQLRGRGSGELLDRFVADVDTLQDLHLRGLTPVLVALLTLAAAALAAWLMLPAAGVLVLLALLLAAAALGSLSALTTAAAARRQAPLRARLTEELIEDIDGSAELALYGRAPERVRRLADADGALARVARGDALRAAAATTLGGCLLGAGLLGLLLLAIPAVHSGALDAVLLAALAFLFLAAFESITPLPAAARSLRACAVAAGRLQDVCAEQPAVLDPPHPRAVGECARGELRAEGLSFRYAPTEPWVLHGFDLRLAPGARVALVGRSGAGKSTLAELLVRFRDPAAGAVTLDGVDARELLQEDLRGAVLLCAQDAHVFNTSVRENLLLARRDATEHELHAALAVVELDRWAASLPQGLDTLVGQDGELCSGGQRQRLALARALISRARFLILDEPTAHLDLPLARRVIGNLLAAAAERGVLLVTHTRELLEGFDAVLRLEPPLGE